jgi:BsuBI/PstI restriction endonuclease domain
MGPGLSSIITKAVVEVFAPRFLSNPAVVWISESGKKVVEKHDKLLQSLGVKITPEKLLPDVILADVTRDDLLFVFVEVVATDGPMHEHRRAALLKLITDAGFQPRQAAFVTAFQRRDHGAFKKAAASLAWGSFAWCFSEPDHLMAFDGMDAGAIKSLRDFPPLKPQD